MGEKLPDGLPVIHRDRRKAASSSPNEDGAGANSSTSDAVVAVLERNYSESDHSNSRAHPLWIRLAAFLSTRAPRTRIAYRAIAAEFCRFLGHEPGTVAGASQIIKATDLNALAYRKFLEQKLGQRPRNAPRGRRTENSSSELPHRNIRARSEPRDGHQQTLANATIAKKLSAMRRMYRALMAGDFGISYNPFDVDRCPMPARNSGQKRPTEMVKFDLVKEILELPDAETPKGLRDKVMLSILFGCGLRRSELVGLKLGDVRTSPQGTPYLMLRATKARKDAEQAVPEWAASLLQALIENRRVEGASDGDFLFIGYRGQGGKVPSSAAISDNGLYRLFKQYCMRAGAGSTLTPHSARATSITKLLTEGFSHREVQEFSRHASVSMVEVYDKRRLSVEDNPGRKLKY